MANCPKCERPLAQLKVERIEIKDAKAKWPGITLSCPHCSVCVSASIDPIKLSDQLILALRKGKSRLL